jgi:threonine/homoserine/homoserine lactone efflux protein
MSWEVLGFVMLIGGVFIFVILFSIGDRVASFVRSEFIQTLLQAIGLTLIGFGASLAAMIFV